MIDPFAIVRAFATLGAAIIVGSGVLIWYTRDALAPAVRPSRRFFFIRGLAGSQSSRSPVPRQPAFLPLSHGSRSKIPRFHPGCTSHRRQTTANEFEMRNLQALCRSASPQPASKTALRVKTRNFHSRTNAPLNSFRACRRSGCRAILQQQPATRAEKDGVSRFVTFP